MSNFVAVNGVWCGRGSREEVHKMLVRGCAKAEGVGEGNGRKDDLLVQIMPIDFLGGI